ncbi:MAG: Zn-ribbon domain-containing OB-fold protein [Haloferacaceae archaeon]
MPDGPAVPAWYTALADAVAAGEGTYLECESCGAVALPPRTLCPSCGESTLVERPLSETATVASFTEIHVTIPAFHGTTPYTVVVAAFDEGVRLTGRLRGEGPVAIGDAVALGVAERDDGRPLLTFEPVAADG